MADGQDGEGSGRGLMLGPGPRGGVLMLRQDTPDSRPEIGEVLPAREGEPIRGEFLDIKPMEPGSPVMAVKSLYKPEEPTDATCRDCGEKRSEHTGPARVNTQAYRDHWDTIFGGSSRKSDPTRSPQTQRSVNSHMN